jgi:hypothetical protein
MITVNTLYYIYLFISASTVVVRTLAASQGGFLMSLNTWCIDALSGI